MLTLSFLVSFSYLILFHGSSNLTLSRQGKKVSSVIYETISIRCRWMVHITLLPTKVFTTPANILLLLTVQFYMVQWWYKPGVCQAKRVRCLADARETEASSTWRRRLTARRLRCKPRPHSARALRSPRPGPASWSVRRRTAGPCRSGTAAGTVCPRRETCLQVEKNTISIGKTRAHSACLE